MNICPKKRHLLIAIVLLFPAFSACGIDPDAPRLVKIGVSHGPTHSFTMAMERFGRNIEEMSGGRYRARVYNSAQIGSEKEMQEMLTIGTLEVTITGVLNTYEPLFSLFELPYLYRDRAHVMRVITSSLTDEVGASLQPKGIHLFGFVENGFRNITNSVRPIETPADVKGLLIRTPENPAQIETMRALGAIPTPMSYSELYTALLQGVVDGQENPLQQIWTGRLFEAQKYCAMTHHIYSSSHVLISERFWETLSVDDREIFRQAIAEASVWQMNYMEDLDTDLEMQLKDTDMEFTYPDREAFAKACQPAYDVLLDRLGPRAREIVARIRAMDQPETE